MNFKDNWVTTAIGAGIGAGNMLLQGVNWQSVLISVAATVLGALAKDPRFSTAAPQEIPDTSNKKTRKER